MTIQTVQMQEDDSFNVTMDSGETLSVPNDMGNRHRVEIQEWADAGGIVDPYTAPLPPTGKERVDAIFNGSDANTTMLETLFKLHNRVLVLEGKPAINLPSFKQLFEEQLPNGN